MGFHRGPKIVTDGLIIALDAGSKRSYPGTGTTWHDLTGNNYSASLNNGAVFDSATQGISFDGTDDHVTFVNDETIRYTPTDSFTLSAMFKLVTIQEWEANQYDTNTTLFGKGSTSGAVGLGLRRTTAGQLSIYAGSRAASQITESYNIEANRIYSTTFTYTPTLQKLYVNGELQSSSDTSGGVGGSFDNTGWRIFYPGAVPGGNSKYGEGTVFLARLYNRVLTADEVLQNYNAQKSRFI
jgi:hypothetical protein